jgi:hypothetical protein
MIASLIDLLAGDLLPQFFAKAPGFTAEKANKIGGTLVDCFFEPAVAALEQHLLPAGGGDEHGGGFPANALLLVRAFHTLIGEAERSGTPAQVEKI